MLPIWVMSLHVEAPFVKNLAFFIFGFFSLSQGTYKMMPGIVRTASDTHTVVKRRGLVEKTKYFLE